MKVFPLQNHTIFRLIDGQEAVTELSKVDDYIANLSTFDCQSWLKCCANDDPVKLTKKYLDFVSEQIIEWDANSVEEICGMIDNFSKLSLDVLNKCQLPKEILLILKI